MALMFSPGCIKVPCSCNDAHTGELQEYHGPERLATRLLCCLLYCYTVAAYCKGGRGEKARSVLGGQDEKDSKALYDPRREYKNRRGRERAGQEYRVRREYRALCERAVNAIMP
jgi:hypothetical protein